MAKCANLCYIINMVQRTTLNVSLTPELSQFINSKLQSGLYTSASEIIREALRLFKSYEEVKSSTITEMKAKIDAGMAQAKTGKVLDGEQVSTDLEKQL